MKGRRGVTLGGPCWRPDKSICVRGRLRFERAECPALPDDISNQHDPATKSDPDDRESAALDPGALARSGSFTSLNSLLKLVARRRWLMLGIECGLLALCLIYCLIAPRQYEAVGRIQLRSSPASELNLGGAAPTITASLFTTPLALETVSEILRSDEVAWRVITGLKLYREPGFKSSFDARFKDFQPDAPSPDSQAWLLDRFEKRLVVQTIPRTLMIEIRFRCRDAVLSAAVVNALIAAYVQRDEESELNATAAASDWLNGAEGPGGFRRSAAGGIRSPARDGELARNHGQRHDRRVRAQLGVARDGRTGARAGCRDHRPNPGRG